MLATSRVGELTEYDRQLIDLLAVQASHVELLSEATGFWDRACRMASDLANGRRIDREDPRQQVIVGRQEVPHVTGYPFEIGDLWFIFNQNSDSVGGTPDVAAIPVYHCLGEALVYPVNGFRMDDVVLIRYLLSEIRVLRNRGKLPNLKDNYAQLEHHPSTSLHLSLQSL